jgi:hypothetical protein
MKTPGFTAEASLYETTKFWRTGEPGMRGFAGAIVPQFPYCFGHPIYGLICCEPWFGICWRVGWVLSAGLQ